MKQFPIRDDLEPLRNPQIEAKQLVIKKRVFFYFSVDERLYWVITQSGQMRYCSETKRDVSALQITSFFQIPFVKSFPIPVSRATPGHCQIDFYYFYGQGFFYYVILVRQWRSPYPKTFPNTRSVNLHSPINQLSSHGTLEESRAAVACQDSIVFSRTGVAAYHAN